MTSNTLTRAPSFINIYAFWEINSIMLQYLHLTKLISANIHLRKLVNNIFCVIENEPNKYYYVIQF